jgi:NAD+ synthase
MSHAPSAPAIVEFLCRTFGQTGKTQAVIAVSGGIDSAVSLTLLAQALPKEQIWPLLLPYERQDMTDAQQMLVFIGIPAANRKTINIASMVEAASQSLQLSADEQLRKGNLMARMRMAAVFDHAKVKAALVIGTENKSEHHLGYFTRFGDSASDVEPLVGLYKTQVRQLATELGLPAIILDKAPSAGLWSGQSDEDELGFSYELADQVLELLIDQLLLVEQVLANFAADQQELVQKVIDRVEAMKFKLEVPYILK